MKISQVVLRRAARHAAEAAGHVVRVKTMRGAVNGSRLEFTEGEAPVSAVVRTSYERLLGFSRKQNGEWRPLETTAVCLIAAPSDRSSDEIEVFEFERDVLKEVFNKALKEMTSLGKAPPNEIPIFVPLDERSSKNLGHSVVGVGKLARWRKSLSASDLAKFTKGLDSHFVARVKREFAELIGVDVSKVVVEFRVVA